jgi:hypothetical protein
MPNPGNHLFIVTHGIDWSMPSDNEPLNQTDLCALPKPRKFGKGRGDIDSDGEPFRLFDDDGNLYFQGVSWNDGTAQQVFLPLDWGMADSGCTEMKMLNAQGAWEVV